MTNYIRVSKDLISEVDSKRFQRYIDQNLDKFQQYLFKNNPQRYSLKFGKDQVYWNMSHTNLALIQDIEYTVREYFDTICQEVERLYDFPRKLYITSFWMARQFPGAVVHAHFDSGEVNQHFKFSSVVYLNELEGSGELVFPKIEFSYKPKANEMITFPSQGEEYLHEVNEINGDRYSLVFWLTDDKDYAL
jgi:hypothetical protein